MSFFKPLNIFVLTKKNVNSLLTVEAILSFVFFEKCKLTLCIVFVCIFLNF